MNPHHVAETVRRALRPEDVFGAAPPTDLRTAFRRLARLLHPDAGARDADAMILLNQWRRRAEEKLARGAWGRAEGATLVAGNTYVDVLPLAAGDVGDVFVGRLGAAGPRVAIKLGAPGNDDLVRNEARVLGTLWTSSAPGAGQFTRYLPRLVEQAQFTVDGQERPANVLELCESGVTLAALRARHPDGLDGRHVGWIWRRLLEVLGWVAQQGIVHGAVLPEHVVVYPSTHGACLLDWSYAVRAGRSIRAISEPRRAFYPPEVFAKRPATSAVDVYMAARCAAFLLEDRGGRLPASVAPFAGLLAACAVPAFGRASDPWEPYEYLGAALRAAYGPPKFVELPI